MRRNSHPLRLPALGCPQKRHHCLCFLQDLHLEPSHLLQCDRSLAQVFYQNSKFPFLESFDEFASMTVRTAMADQGQTQHQRTARSLGFLVLTCSCLCSAKPTPFHTSQGLFYFRSHTLGYQITQSFYPDSHFNQPLQHSPSVLVSQSQA